MPTPRVAGKFFRRTKWEGGRQSADGARDPFHSLTVALGGPKSVSECLARHFAEEELERFVVERVPQRVSAYRAHSQTVSD